MKDLSISGNSPFISNEADLIIQQIDMLFDTLDGEVLGEDYGCNFYDFLWDLTASPDDISNYTLSVIYANVNLFSWSIRVETNILKGSENDIILVTIKLSNSGTTLEKTYKVE